MPMPDLDNNGAGGIPRRDPPAVDAFHKHGGARCACGLLLWQCRAQVCEHHGPVTPLPLVDSNPKTAFGTKKPGLHAIPPVALLWLGAAMEEGRQKYGIVNWRDAPITASTYLNAAYRHLLAHLDGQTLDPDSPDGRTPHLAKIMACCAILIDAAAQGTLTDDRGTPGKAADLIAEMTRK